MTEPSSTSAPAQFFLITGETRAPTLLRVALTLELQQSLTALFDAQRQILCAPDRDRIPFDGRYRPREDQLFEHRPFVAPTALVESIRFPLGCRLATAEDLATANIRGFMCAGVVDGRIDARIQAFEKRQVLRTNRTNIFMSKDTFVRAESPGLMIGDKLTAHIDGDALYFQSFAKTRQVLDLGSVYVEATTPDIHRFFAHPVFDSSQLGALRDTDDQHVRQKIASLLQNKVFERLVPTQLAAVGERVGLNVQLIRDTEAPERILLPGDKKELKHFLRVLDEDYLQSLFDENRVFETNGKRAVAGRR